MTNVILFGKYNNLINSENCPTKFHENCSITNDKINVVIDNSVLLGSVGPNNKYPGRNIISNMSSFGAT